LLGQELQDLREPYQKAIFDELPSGIEITSAADIHGEKLTSAAPLYNCLSGDVQQVADIIGADRPSLGAQQLVPQSETTRTSNSQWVLLGGHSNPLALLERT